jgi:tRNA-binding protein
VVKETKPTVSVADSLDKLDVRVGRVIEVELESSTVKPTYRMVVDFGKFGRRVCFGRFTRHPVEDVKGRLVLAVLNFAPREMASVVSEALVLGVQYPKEESGEATFVSPATNAKIGSKLF